ncbi:DNA polymerase III subunit chi [Curvibacter sp. CHRR-16]|uniref:DNA polymerase III subunit chi n=1 Tax=Curvibacter sp. CHRR-16 TaxID=2835872 RepID=UPI001BDB303C|nr:DNA polymerase III subunit chi [Curvibacter sp. CHRR-16]
MTEVAFHFGASDKWNYLCRLTRKAIAKGVRIQIHGPQSLLDRVDAKLWNFESTAFIAHCRHGDAFQERCAVVLADSVFTPRNGASWVLLNLAEEVPAGVEAFARVIEVVGLDEHDRQQARNRWREYTRRGLPIVRHDLTGRAD